MDSFQAHYTDIRDPASSRASSHCCATKAW